MKSLIFERNVRDVRVFYHHQPIYTGTNMSYQNSAPITPVSDIKL